MSDVQHVYVVRDGAAIIYVASSFEMALEHLLPRIEQYRSHDGPKKRPEPLWCITEVPVDVEQPTQYYRFRTYDTNGLVADGYK